MGLPQDETCADIARHRLRRRWEKLKQSLRVCNFPRGVLSLHEGGDRVAQLLLRRRAIRQLIAEHRFRRPPPPAHYRLGAVLYWPFDDKQKKVTDLPATQAIVIDVKQPIIFDGTKAHGVSPYESERHSIAYYTMKGYERMQRRHRKLLQRLWFRVPPAVCAPAFLEALARGSDPAR